MVTTRLPNDTVTIAPGVLLTIARMATLDVPGVMRMGSTPGGVDRLWRRVPAANGALIAIEDGKVTAHLYVVADASANLREMSVSIQKSVARSIREILDMGVESINVHIEDVCFVQPPKPDQS
ncbi:MAG: Asp23/Gls24 family envelope stress response protein [Anaerolineae bacterium]|nr:Asp23/Gls24 family envelope stress response protein [Anaerolineae bacterium]